ncbi:hypothetical protein [Fluoribacter gormanii]|uniref:hypothetical protein n=1 Tax=Fluoribacter gormanii TaxID=464 RepID=UPI00104132A1|nr:hypothetical protein [Fluoribacter gormanii]
MAQSNLENTSSALTANIIDTMIQKPGDVLKIATELVSQAENSTGKDYEEMAVVIKDIVKNENYFSSLNVVNNYTYYYDAISNWPPECSFEEQAAAAPFQCALLDELETIFISQLNENKETILKKIDLLGDKSAKASFKELFDTINGNEEENDFFKKREASIKISKLISDIEHNEQIIVKLIAKLEEYTKELQPLKTQLTEEVETQRKKLIPLDSKALQLGLKSANLDEALDRADQLKAIIADESLSLEVRVDKFNKLLEASEKTFKAASTKVSEGILWDIVALVKEFIFPAPQKPNIVEEFKNSIMQIKKTGLDNEKQEEGCSCASKYGSS